MSLRIGIIGGAGHIGYIVQGVKELGDAAVCAVAPGCAAEDVDQVKKRSGAGPDVTV